MATLTTSGKDCRSTTAWKKTITAKIGSKSRTAPSTRLPMASANCSNSYSSRVGNAIDAGYGSCVLSARHAFQRLANILRPARYAKP